MNTQLLLSLFEKLFIFAFVALMAVKVYKTMKSKGLDFAGYVKARKYRLLLGAAFVASSLGYTIFCLGKV